MQGKNMKKKISGRWRKSRRRFMQRGNMQEIDKDADVVQREKN